MQLISRMRVSVLCVFTLLSLSAPNPVLSQQDDAEARIASLSSRLEQDTATIPELVELARLHIGQGSILTAETVLERARLKGADFGQVATPSAKILLAQGRFREALELLRGVTVPANERYEAAIIEGDALFALRDLKESRAVYRRASEIDPNSFSAFLGLARLSIQENNLAAARQAAENAVALGPDQTMAHYTLGLVERYEQNSEAAIDRFRLAVTLNAKNILALNELADIALAAEQLEEAERYLDQVFGVSRFNLRSTFLQAVVEAKRRNFDESYILLRRAGRFVQGYLPGLYVQGLVAYEIGRYAVAEDSLRRVLSVRPGNVEARLALAATFLQQQNALSAIDLLSPMLEGKGPKSARLFSLAAAAHSARGETDKSALYLEKASDITGGADSEFTVRLSLAQVAEGKPEVALQTLREAVANGNEDVRHLGVLANIQIREKHFDRALLTAERLIEIAPERGLGFNVRGTIAHYEGRYADAITDYSQALQLNTDYHTARRNRALAYYALEQLAPARTDLRQLLRYSPSDARSRALLGRISLRLGRTADAVDDLTIASLQLGEPPEVQIDLARALMLDGKTARAIKVARATMGSAGEQPQLLRSLGELLLDLEQPPLAAASLSRYLAFNPVSVPANILYGRALLQGKLYTGARLAFERARKLAKVAGDDIEEQLNWYALLIAVRSGKAEVAEDIVSTLTPDSRPEDVPLTLIASAYLALDQRNNAHDWLATAYERTPTEDLLKMYIDVLDLKNERDAATELLVAHIDERNLSSRILVNLLADRFYDERRYQLAAQRYENSLGQKVADPVVAARLARSYLALGRRESATLARQAHLLDPQNPEILDVYGWTLLQAERDYNAALPLLENAVRRAPGQAVYRYHLGMAYLTAGREFDAIEALRSALALDGDFEGADVARAQLRRYDG